MTFEETKLDPGNDQASTHSSNTTESQEAPKLAKDEDTVVVHKGGETILNRIIKRFGGRHLIFRTQLDDDVRWVPRPYALVSTFRGPVWFFYGLGQVWLTHKKYHAFDGWMARVPRFAASKVTKLLDRLEDQLTQFTHHCNEQGIEGTLIVEPTTIEFHWTFAYSLEQEKRKKEESQLLDDQFELLVEAFLEAKKNLD